MVGVVVPGYVFVVGVIVRVPEDVNIEGVIVLVVGFGAKGFL